jgi:hypothetical protein
MSTAKIYAIAERAGPIHYGVRTTQSIDQRIKLHMAKKAPIGLWMQDNDYAPLVLEECPKDKAQERERFWIVQCRSAGHPLLNANGFAPTYNHEPPKPSKPKKAVLPEFQAVLDRCWPLRITEAELLELTDFTPTTWWRAKTGVSQQGARTRILAQAEKVVSDLEADRIRPCSLCGERVTKPCNQFGCPITKDEA